MCIASGGGPLGQLSFYSALLPCQALLQVHSVRDAQYVQLYVLHVLPCILVRVRAPHMQCTCILLLDTVSMPTPELQYMLLNQHSVISTLANILPTCLSNEPPVTRMQACQGWAHACITVLSSGDTKIAVV